MLKNNKKILIIGNLGYIGPVLVKHLRGLYPKAILVGVDNAYFQNCLISPVFSYDHLLDSQIYADVRSINSELFSDVDSVVSLAAISNDPMGSAYETPTKEINTDAVIKIATMAKSVGVKNFIFASSCSVYGALGEEAKNEKSPLNPLSAYARSKIATEESLENLSGSGFIVTCLRFATACGASPRLRLDLVLNDFVAGAILSRKIEILSDGTPWRPLIDTQDMATAIEWGLHRDALNGGNFLVVNTGSNDWNFTIRDLAKAVQAHIPDIEVLINTDAPPDRRSYKVDFSLFKQLAPDFYPSKTLQESIIELSDLINSAPYISADFRNSNFMRLNTLRSLKNMNKLDEDLNWV